MPDGVDTRPEGGRGYLSFEVAGEGYAMPLGLVREILRVPPLVRVPQSPASLDGLGNLRGRVLPVVSLGGLLRKPARPPTAAERVLVLDRASLVGLRVDRVGALLAVGVEDPTRGETRVGGTVLRVHGAEFRLIDPAGLLAGDFKPQPRATRSGLAHAVGLGARQGAPSRQVGVIGFELAGQDYALPLDAVREVLPIPSDLAALPGDDDAVLGVATVRGRVLPILSGSALLGLPSTPSPEGRGRVIVVSLGRARFGMRVDRTTAIHRPDADSLDPMPAILRRGPRPEAEVQAIVRMGGRLVGLLSPERLLSRERMERVTDLDDEDGVMEPTSATLQTQQFVLFRLGETECGVPIDAAEEVVRVPERFSALPRTPSCVLGVTTLRGRALPVIDLRGRLDLPPGSPTGRERILVLSSKGRRVGFLVDAVSEVARLPASAIEPAPELADGRAVVVTQAANLAEAGRLILLVDVERLLDGTEMLAEDSPVP